MALRNFANLGHSSAQADSDILSEFRALEGDPEGFSANMLPDLRRPDQCWSRSRTLAAWKTMQSFEETRTMHAEEGKALSGNPPTALQLEIMHGFLGLAERLIERGDLRSLERLLGTRATTYACADRLGGLSADRLLRIRSWVAEASAYEQVHGVGSRLDRQHIVEREVRPRIKALARQAVLEAQSDPIAMRLLLQDS